MNNAQHLPNRMSDHHLAMDRDWPDDLIDTLITPVETWSIRFYSSDAVLAAEQSPEFLTYINQQRGHQEELMARLRSRPIASDQLKKKARMALLAEQGDSMPPEVADHEKIITWACVDYLRSICLSYGITSEEQPILRAIGRVYPALERETLAQSMVGPRAALGRYKDLLASGS